ncbi:hypothetical protein [Streptacidiphilus monticola]|uniref:DUF2304 domain-containing protein n=1 Tax=Streptacidiphilus monticola TaxID=2161674 RepID=A0ABW1G7G6_9ACTN
MLFTISAALLFGVILAIMLRFRAVTAGGATVAALFGFYLASTGLAPAVNHTVVSIFHALAGVH